MIMVIGYFIGMIIAIIWDHKTKDFKGSIISFLMFIACFFGFIVGLVTMLVQYFI